MPGSLVRLCAAQWTPLGSGQACRHLGPSIVQMSDWTRRFPVSTSVDLAESLEPELSTNNYQGQRQRPRFCITYSRQIGPFTLRSAALFI